MMIHRVVFGKVVSIVMDAFVQKKTSIIAVILYRRDIGISYPMILFFNYCNVLLTKAFAGLLLSIFRGVGG